MEKSEIELVKNMMFKADYQSKKEIYKNTFTFGYIDADLNTKFALISLVALTSYKLRDKNPSLTTLDILLKITGQTKDYSAFYHFLESLAIIVEDFSYGCTKFESFGLKTSSEIINKIKEILNKWHPF